MAVETMARVKRADPTENADQAEAAALRMGMAPIGAGTIDDRLADNDEDFLGDPDLVDNTWDRGKGFEEADNATTTEIDRRAQLLGDAYPFARERSRLTYTGSETGLYEFLLGLSLAESYSRGPYAVLPRVFEVLACLVAEAYLGEDADSYRMGWPRPKGTATTLKAAVGELRQKSGGNMGEWVWAPKEGNPTDPSPGRAKEQGLDVVAWKRSIDGRAGQLYLLGQCACGKSWSTDAKLQDMNTKLLNEWISEISCVDPIRAIFTPRHALDEELPFISRHGGLVFDRIRLTLLGLRPRVASKLSTRPKTVIRLTKLCLQ